MRNYEAMFILRPDLIQSEKDSIFGQIKQTLSKFKADIHSETVWQEKRKLCFRLGIKGQPTKFSEGLYYLVNFSLLPSELAKLKATLHLNDNILRFLIIRSDNIASQIATKQ